MKRATVERTIPSRGRGCSPPLVSPGLFRTVAKYGAAEGGAPPGSLLSVASLLAVTMIVQPNWCRQLGRRRP